MLKLWYKKQASEWVEALPIGNGHMGAMCYDGKDGKYDLSENTCWSGEEQECCLKKNATNVMKKHVVVL